MTESYHANQNLLFIITFTTVVGESDIAMATEEDTSSSLQDTLSQDASSQNTPSSHDTGYSHRLELAPGVGEFLQPFYEGREGRGETLEAILSALTQPPPFTCIRVNTISTTPEALLLKLKSLLHNPNNGVFI